VMDKTRNRNADKARIDCGGGTIHEKNKTFF
jgi:hypothetical protein